MINDDLAYRGAYITGCFHICLNSDLMQIYQKYLMKIWVHFFMNTYIFGKVAKNGW